MPRTGSAYLFMLAIMSLAAVAPSSGWAQGAPVNLTNNTQTDIRPVWSPDGTKIAFLSERIGNRKVYVMNADGTNPVQLGQGDGHDESPAWSPDGTKIAFISSPTGERGIYVVNADGTDPVRLTRGRDVDHSPRWSPDGAKIAFASYWPAENNETSEIYVMNADGTGLVRLTRSDGYDRDLAWSPDGTKIAFVSERTGDNKIYAINADGTNLVRLTQGDGHDGSPGWSLDGTKIAFMSNRDGDYEIYVMNADGTNPVRLTRSDGYDGNLAWSPDGTKIAFVSTRTGNSEIYVMNADGTNLVRLTQNYDSAGFPAWSPYGIKIAFQSDRDGDWEIYVTPSGSVTRTPPEHGDTRERATAVGQNSTTPGTLEQSGDVDYFRVDLTQAGHLTVWTNGPTDTVGYLQNQGGRDLAGDDDAGPEANFHIVREVEPGTYYVAVVGGVERTATGAYLLKVRFTAGGRANTRAEAIPAEVNTGVSAALEQAGDIDYFRLEIRQAGTLTVETTGDTDTFGYFGAADGGWLEEDDDGGWDANFRIVWEVTPGTYYVAVAGGAGHTATGHYTLFAVSTESGGGGGPAEHGNSRAQATEVEPNMVTAGSLERSGDVDYFQVYVTQAGRLTVETTGETDTVGVFQSAQGRSLAEDDDAGTGNNFRIARDVTPGLYYIAVRGVSRSETGVYTLRLAFTPAEDHGNTERGDRRATLLNLSPWQAWVHLYCLKDRAGPDANPPAPCAVTFECNGQSGEPVAWPVTVAPKTIFSYWPNKTASDGTAADLQAALIAAGKPEDEARRRTTCEVFSPDPLTVRGYALFGGQPTLVPVAEPARPDAAAAPGEPRRQATLPNLSPGQAWVHLYCLKDRGTDAAPCAVTFKCNGLSGDPVTWPVTVAPKTIFSYWPNKMVDGLSADLQAALIAAGKPEDEARRRTTCEVSSADPIAVRGYTRFGGQPTLVPVTAY